MVLTQTPTTTATPTPEALLARETRKSVTVEQALTETLPTQGFDRFTRVRIESVLCTSALSAHI
jgi:hypothetical protein